MSIRRIEIERFSLTSSRPFEAVVAALKAGVGRLDLAEFARASKGPGTFADLKKVIERDLGRAGLMLFIELDHGAVLRKESGLNAPKSVALCNRKSSHHEGNGKTCSRRRIIRSC